MSTPLQFLHESGVVPLHRRGQNFLIDKNIIKKISDAANIKKTDTIVEIGSGSGELTCELAKHAKKVYAIEIDAHLFEVLDSRFRGNDRVTLIKDDIRAVSLKDVILSSPVGERKDPEGNSKKRRDSSVSPRNDISYRVIANIPYHITSQIIRKFLEEHPRPKDLILLMQKEVAKRIVAQPPQMSLLAVSVQYYADAKILFPVSRNSFFPKPNVDSAVVRLVVHCHSGRKRGISMLKSTGSFAYAQDDNINDTFFFSVVRAGFSAKRKQCAQTIAKKLHVPLSHVIVAFQKLGIPEKARAQEISVEQWKKIVIILIGVENFQ